MMYPYISVVITAHNRREFLKRSIQSALNQSLSREFYEIIVVKNFDDVEIDDFIERNAIYSIRSPYNSKIGEDLSKGIENAKGNVLSFLDDDDEFLPDNLEKVFNIFKKDDKIIYYHNHQIIEGNNRNKIVHKTFKGVYYTGELKRRFKSIINSLGLASLYFNLSSISIRKIYYTEHVKQLEKLIIQPDDFIFFVGLEEDCKFYFDSSALTKYTIHESLSNVDEKAYKRSNYLIKNYELMIKFASATRYISSLVRDRRIRDVLEARSDLELLSSTIFIKRIDTSLWLKCMINTKKYGLRLTAFSLFFIFKTIVK